MRLQKLTLRGLTCFREQVALDLTPYGPGLVAIVGENGSGKTTILESVFAVLHKTFPSRPKSLYTYAQGADAFISCVFVDGESVLEARLLINAGKTQTESYLFENDRSLTSGRAAEYGAEVERRFGTAQLILASVFAAQDKTGSFLLMPKSKRKELFAELLALNDLSAISEYARNKRSVVVSTLDRLDAALCVLSGQLTEPDGQSSRAVTESALEKGQSTAQALEASLAECQARVTALTERAEEARQQQKQLSHATLRVTETAKAADTAKAHLQTLEDQAQRYLSALRSEVATLRSQAEGLNEEQVRTRFDTERQRLEKRRVALQASIEDAAAVQSAVEKRPRVSKEREQASEDLAAQGEASRAVTAAERSLRMCEQADKDAAAARARERELMEAQAATFHTAPCTASEEWVATIKGSDTPQPLSALCPALALSRDAIDRLKALEVTPRASQATVQAAKALKEARAQQLAPEALRELIARHSALKQEETRLRELAERDALYASYRVQIESIEDDLRRLDGGYQVEIEQMRNKREGLASRIEVFEGNIADAEQGFQASRAEAQRRYDDAATLARVAASACEQIRSRGALLEGVLEELRAEQDQHTAIGRSLFSVQASQQVLTAQLEEIRSKEFEVSLKERERADLASRLTTWQLLETAFGKDGIQALEIDAAGPEIASLTNELLRSCYGPRFSVSFETLRLKRDGGYSEVFDVRVYDGAATRDFEALSGGEKVIVAETIGLAFGIYNKRKSGITWETLFRDETASALDPENAQAYIRLLRKALELGGFYHVLFVSHVPEVWQAADVQFQVATGQITAL